MSIERKSAKRQAVVIIHGMGEQWPMATLRSFLKGTHDVDQQFYSRPYKRSAGENDQNYDAYRLSTSEIEAGKDSEDGRLKTDFYELYWAHHLEAGSSVDTLKWVWKSIIRVPFWKHHRQTQLVIGFLQFLIILSVVAAILVERFTSWRISMITLLLVGIVMAVVWKGFRPKFLRFFAETLADPPRYIIPKPGHIKARNEIRNEGVQLLRQLHEVGFYERVIVVGHSLGSIIGLDMLRLCWDEYRHPDPVEYSGTEAVREKFIQCAKNLGVDRVPTAQEIEVFQNAQHDLWLAYRESGMKWLVTDFITLGSPLAHAEWLIFENEVAKKSAFTSREYPTCPPDVGRGIFYKGCYVKNEDAYVAHHAAPFTMTRWSNAYFPMKGLYGDPVGGDLGPVFGYGIRDVQVRVESLREKSPAGLIGRAHIQYWNRELDPEWEVTAEYSDVTRQRKKLSDSSDTQVAHQVLQEFLKLDFPPEKKSDAGTDNLDRGVTPFGYKLESAPVDAMTDETTVIIDVSSPLV